MTLRLKSSFFLLTGLLLLWFLYVERAILTPFILAAIFAYIFNPIVNLFSHRLKFPRTLSVIVIYLVIISVIILSGFAFSKRIVEESFELKKEATFITQTARNQIETLPDWIKPTVNDVLYTFEKSTTGSPSLFAFFPTAFSRILSFIVFLFAAFYFLKEGRSMFDKLLNFVPNNYKVEADILSRKISSVLGSYLRGQLFLVFFVSIVLFIILTILGVKFSLILAVFSGFAEIVPIIGPIVAAIVAGIVALVGGGSGNFGLSPIQLAVTVIIAYTIVRQFQDYFVNPLIMGRITKLHPLIILFSVIAGEHTAGILGLILAVPIAGILRIIFEYSLDKITDKEIDSSTK